MIYYLGFRHDISNPEIILYNPKAAVRRCFTKKLFLNSLGHTFEYQLFNTKIDRNLQNSSDAIEVIIKAYLKCN